MAHKKVARSEVFSSDLAFPFEWPLCQECANGFQCAAVIRRVRVVLSTALPVKVGVVLDPAAISIDIVGPRIDIEWSVESGELFQRNQIQARVEGRFDVAVYQPAAIYRVATAAAEPACVTR